MDPASVLLKKKKNSTSAVKNRRWRLNNRNFKINYVVFMKIELRLLFVPLKITTIMYGYTIVSKRRKKS